MTLSSRTVMVVSWSSFVFALAACMSAAGQSSAPYRLSMPDAIQRGLQANLGVLVARTRVEEAEGPDCEACRPRCFRV